MQKLKFKQTEIGMIPEDWELKTLKELCLRIYSGGTPNTRDNSLWDGQIPWLSSGETKQVFVRATNRTISQKGVDNSSTKLAKKGSTVVASAGQGHTRGQAAYLMIDTYINQSIVVLEPNSSQINKHYLYYLLLSKYDRLRDLSDSHSSRGSLTCKLLEIVKIALPALIEQTIISKILTDLDLQIELLQQQNKTLEKIGKIIFKQWFVDFEFPNEQGKPYKSSDGKMIESELGEIPENWRISTVGAELKTILGGTPSRVKNEYWENGNISWINSGKVNEFRIINPSELITDIALKKSATKLMPKRTTVLAITGATLGQVSLLEIDSCANQSVIGVLESEFLKAEFIFYLINDKIEHLISNQTGGAQQHINKNNVDSLKFILPDNIALNKYYYIQKELLNKVTINVFEIESLQKTRDLLLPKLMTGKIRVPMGALK